MSRVVSKMKGNKRLIVILFVALLLLSACSVIASTQPSISKIEIEPLILSESEFEFVVIPGDFKEKSIEYELVNSSFEIVDCGKLDFDTDSLKIKFSNLPSGTPFLVRFKGNDKVFFEFSFRTLKRLNQEDPIDILYFVDLTNTIEGYVKVSIFGNYSNIRHLNFKRYTYHLSPNEGMELVNDPIVTFYEYLGDPKYEYDENYYYLSMYLSDSTKGYFKINYVCDKSKIYLSGHGVEGHLNERYFIASHEQFLILPDLYDINMVDLDSFVSAIIPYGWEIDTWWKRTDLGLLKIDENKIPEDINEFRCIWGALHFYAFNPDFFEVFVKKIGDTNVKVIKEKSIKSSYEISTFKIYEKLLEHWGEDVDYRNCDYKDYTVMFVDENTQVYAGEYTDAQAFSKVWGVGEMLVHQIFHRWNGWACGIEIEVGEDDDNYSYGLWAEGVNEFYCDKILTELSLTYPNEYMTAWYKYYKEIYGSEKDCPIIYFDFGKHDSYLPYGKGAVIAYYLDKRLTEISNGEYSMDDVLKYFFKRWKEKRLGFSYYEFFNYLEKLGGKEFVKEAREIIYNNKKIVLEEFE